MFPVASTTQTELIDWIFDFSLTRDFIESGGQYGRQLQRKVEQPGEKGWREGWKGVRSILALSTVYLL